MSGMLAAIKHRQAERPTSRFHIWLLGDDIQVKLLPNGYVEWDGQIPLRSREAIIEAAITQFGAVLAEDICL